MTALWLTPTCNTDRSPNWACSLQSWFLHMLLPTWDTSSFLVWLTHHASHLCWDTTSSRKHLMMPSMGWASPLCTVASILPLTQHLAYPATSACLPVHLSSGTVSSLRMRAKSCSLLFPQHWAWQVVSPYHMLHEQIKVDRLKAGYKRRWYGRGCMSRSFWGWMQC